MYLSILESNEEEEENSNSVSEKVKKLMKIII